jgi:hypothetical protein
MSMNVDSEHDLDAFLDIVCGEAEFVRAKFEAIIAACWDDTSSSPPRRDRPGFPRPRPRRSDHFDGSGHWSPRFARPVGLPGRSRGPPAGITR